MCIPVKWASIFHFNAMLIGSQFCLAFFCFIWISYIFFFIVSVYMLCVSTRLSWRPHLLTSAFLQRTKPGTVLRAILSTIGMFAVKFYMWLHQRKKLYTWAISQFFSIWTSMQADVSMTKGMKLLIVRNSPSTTALFAQENGWVLVLSFVVPLHFFFASCQNIGNLWCTKLLTWTKNLHWVKLHIWITWP